MIGWQFGYWGGRELEKRGNWKSAASIYQRLWDQGESTNPRVAYKLGHAYFRLENLDQARNYISIAVGLNPNIAAWHYRLGFIQERQKLWADALHSYNSAIALDPERAEWLYRRSLCEQALGEKVLAQESLRSAIHLDPRNAKFHKALGKQLGQGAARWQEIEALEDGLSLHMQDPDWLIRLAQAYFEMERFSEAASLYERALLLRPEDAGLLFAAGLSHAGKGAPDVAQQWFDRAVNADSELGAARFGPGVFFEAMNDWQGARHAYASHLQLKPLDAEMHYRHGLANDRCYRWPDAVASYQAAVALKADESYWHYRLGFAEERLGNLQAAADSYQEAIRVSGARKSYWRFRLAYVLQEMGRFEEASDAYLTAAALKTVEQIFDSPAGTPPTAVVSRLRGLVRQSAEAAKFQLDANSFYQIALNAEKLGDWVTAAELYGKAVVRSNDHKPEWYGRFGHALIRTGELEKACESFRMSRIFSRPQGVNEKGYSKSPAVKTIIEYVEYYENLAIVKNTVLYESNLAASIDCNPLSIFEKIVDDPDFSDFVHIWTVASEDVPLPESLLGRDNVRLTIKQSDLYLRYLATAEYLINNSTFPSYFIRKDGQSYLNTWHGTPLKKMGTDVEGAALEHANVTRNLLQTTHLLTSNEHTTDVLTRAFGVDQLFSGRVALTGYPRIDKTVKPSVASREAVFRLLGLDPHDQKPIVLYAPTWRGSMNAKVLDSEAMARDIAALATPKDFHLVVRAHHYTEDLLVGSDREIGVVPRSLTTNDLLSVVDLLITDYSSVVFDYMSTGRPVVLYVPDLDEYSAERGLYFNLSSLPGPVCRTVDEVLEGVRNGLASDTVHPSYASNQARFTPAEDGNAAARAVAFFFGGDSCHEVRLPKKESSLLFRHGMNPNGMTASLLNLLQALDGDRHAMTLLIDAPAVSNDTQRLAAFRALPDSVRTVGRVGRHIATVEERWIVSNFNRFHDFPADEQREIYLHAYRREFRRIFGVSVFDALVEFDGYSPFMASILLGGRNLENTADVFLHNDMLAEMRSKYPYLRSMFTLYREFDDVISVSKALSAVNSSNLAERFEISEEKFVHTPNIVIPQKIIDRATDQIDSTLFSWLNEPGKTFVMSARLSPEKDHAKLLRAFRTVVEESPDTRLLLIGDGVLASDLRRLTDDLGLSPSVLFAGMQDNPFAILRRSDCFILSSNHEGQPMVLLEAMVLGMPIIATDIDGSRGVLAGPDGEHGLLVPNSVDGLIGGMRAYLAGKVPPAQFDAEKYMAGAIAKFESVVGSDGALTG